MHAPRRTRVDGVEISKRYPKLLKRCLHTVIIAPDTAVARPPTYLASASRHPVRLAAWGWQGGRLHDKAAGPGGRRARGAVACPRPGQWHHAGGVHGCAAYLRCRRWPLAGIASQQAQLERQIGGDDIYPVVAASDPSGYNSDMSKIISALSGHGQFAVGFLDSRLRHLVLLAGPGMMPPGGGGGAAVCRGWLLQRVRRRAPTGRRQKNIAARWQRPTAPLRGLGVVSSAGAGITPSWIRSGWRVEDAWQAGGRDSHLVSVTGRTAVRVDQPEPQAPPSPVSPITVPPPRARSARAVDADSARADASVADCFRSRAEAPARPLRTRSRRAGRR